MKRVYGVEQIERSGAARVTIGTFDGVHLGHRTIIEYLVERARTLGGESVVVSFDPHPRDVLTQDPMPLLTTIEERARKLEAAGLDRFVVLPFTPAFAQMEADVFVREVLWERLGAQEVVIGYDHAFGNRRAGDAALLQRLGEELGFAVDVIPAQLLAEHVISSTEIRRRLHAGQVAQAAELLGSPYSLEGPVVHGDHRGRTIGFPTANIAVSHPKKLIPKRGVYAVWAYPAGETTRWPGMMNVGVRPTFDGEEVRLEVHLIGADLDLYDTVLRVEFVEHVRDERKFDTIEALVAQLAADQAHCTKRLHALSSDDMHAKHQGD